MIALLDIHKGHGIKPAVQSNDTGGKALVGYLQEQIPSRHSGVSLSRQGVLSPLENLAQPVMDSIVGDLAAELGDEVKRVRPRDRPGTNNPQGFERRILLGCHPTVESTGSKTHVPDNDAAPVLVRVHLLDLKGRIELALLTL
jgi:hypothetical protein